MISSDSNELLPSKNKDRTIKTSDLIILCSGMVINVVGLIIPAQIYLNGGMTPSEVIFSALFGFVLVSTLITLNGDIGTKYGVPFTIYIRDFLGKKGALIGSLFRAVVCLVWSGVIIYLGAMSISALIDVLFGESLFWPIFVVFASLQFHNASGGIKSMSKFGWFSIPALGVMLLGMVIFLIKQQYLTLPEVMSKPAIMATDGFTFIGAVAIFAGGWLSEALNGSDLSRRLILKKYKEHTKISWYSRNRSMIIAFFTGFIITGLIVSSAGLIFGLLTGIYNPVELIRVTFSDNPFILGVTAIIIIAAQWTTNTVANIFPATLILMNIAPKLSFKQATWIVGLISCGTMPWLLIDHLDIIQVIFSAFLGPLLSIMIIHYYIIRGGILDIEKIYSSDCENWNFSGITSLFFGVIVGSLFGDQAFFVSFPASGLLYLLIMKIKLSRTKSLA